MFRIIVCVFLVMSISCRPSEQRAAGVLNRNEMVKVLADIYISEEKVVRLNLQQDSASIVAAILRSKTLQRLNVSDSTFAKSFDYYMDRPKEMEEIYSVLVDTLQLREQRSSHRAY